MSSRLKPKQDDRGVLDVLRRNDPRVYFMLTLAMTVFWTADRVLAS